MKKIVAILLVLLFALIIVLPGLMNQEEKEEGITFNAEPIELTEAQLAMIGCHDQDMQKIASDGVLTLYMNMVSGEFCVENLAEGTKWYSNPVDWNQDSLATPNTQELLGSQLIVEFYDQSNKRSTLNSYNDCFKRGQLYITKKENGVRVDYLIGVLKKKDYCPRVIRADAFKEIQAGLSEYDAETLSIHYQKITKNTKKETWEKLKLDKLFTNARAYEEFYVLRSTAGIAAQKEIGQLIGTVGWGSEEIEAEHTLFGYVPEEVESGCFVIPVEYRLEQGTFVAEILSDEIQVQKGYYLSQIELLPYFVAGGAEDEGYLLIPDGSGALLKLNDTTQYGYVYQQPIYGVNTALAQQLQTQSFAQIYLPVYGISTQRGAVLAVVESGEAEGSVKATLAGELSSVNAVGSIFAPSVKDYMSYDNLMNVEGAYIFTKKRVSEHYTVRYSFLNAGSGYSEMAAAYRQYLINNNILHETQTATEFYLDLVGAVDKRETLLGVPYTTYAALTTFEQAKTILNQLQSYGVQNISVRYTGWANNGLDNSLYDNANPLSVLGGKKGLKDLIAYANQKNIELYMDAEMVLMRSTALFDGFSSGSDGVRTVARKVATLRSVSKSTGELSSKAWYLLGAEKQTDTMTSFLKSYSKYQNANVSFASLGQYLYGDYRKSDLLHRSAFLEKTQQLLASKVAGKYNVLFDGANAGVLAYASGLLNVPMTSSELLLADRTIPFYQMVISGCLSYAGQPINLSGDWKTEILDAAQTGASLHYQWMYAQNSVLYDTEYTDLYALHYSTWLKDTVSATLQYQQDMKPVAGKQIILHEAVEGCPNVFRTVFEGGHYVLVNYGKLAVSTPYGEIAARSYAVREGGI